MNGVGRLPRVCELPCNDPNSADLFPGARRLVEVPAFAPTEIAYRALTMKGAGPWKRKVCTKESEFDRTIARLQERGCEILTRPAELSK